MPTDVVTSACAVCGGGENYILLCTNEICFKLIIS